MPGAESNQGIYRKTIEGGKWYAFGMGAQRLLNFFSLIILARLLTPADYGVLAVVFLVTGILEDVFTPGFSTALLQKKDDGEVEKYLDIVWTWDLMKSIGLALVIYFGAGYISDFFKLTDGKTVIGFSGLFLVIAALSNRRQLYFFKNLDFKKIFIRDLSSQIVFAVVAVCWALFIQSSFWALFIGHIARYVSSMIISYALDPAAMRFNFFFKKLRSLISYSKWIYGQNVLNYFTVSIDKIFIGRLLDSTELGLYSRAKDLPNVVASPLLNIIRRVGFSSFVKIQDQLDKVREGFLKSLDLLLLATVPCSILLILEGGALVSFFLGPNWISIVIPLKLFSVGSIVISLVSLTRPVLNAIGKPEINFRSNLLQVIIAPPLLFYGIQSYQLWGAVMATLAIWLVIFLYTIYIVQPILKVSRRSLMPTLSTLSAASVATFILDVLLRGPVHASVGLYGQVIWVAFLGLVFLAVTLLVNRLFATGPIPTLLGVLRELRAQRSESSVAS